MLKSRFSEAYAALRKTVVEERKKAGMKQVDLATALSVHQSLISTEIPQMAPPSCRQW